MWRYVVVYFLLIALIVSMVFVIIAAVFLLGLRVPEDEEDNNPDEQ